MEKNIRANQSPLPLLDCSGQSCCCIYILVIYEHRTKHVYLSRNEKQMNSLSTSQSQKQRSRDDSFEYKIKTVCERYSCL